MNQLDLTNFNYILDAWNKHVKEDPSSKVLTDCNGYDLKRSEVDELSSKVYRYLKNNNISKEDFILICLDRGVKPIIAILGVLKAGAAFSIVESTYAKERIEFIKNDCKAKLVIDEETYKEILNLEPLQGYEQVNDHDACLTVYTSGTTGTPKGVLHEYGQLKLEMISEQRKDGSWREDRSTRWGLVAPLNFVASIKIVVHFLYSGGHLYVLDYDTIKNPKKLDAYFLLHKINETFLSPSLLRLKGKDLGPFMKYVYTGAEAANGVSLNKGELNNTYTMSESFFTVCEYIIDKEYDVCPIGKTLFDLDIKLVKEDGSLAKENETGEFAYYNPYCRGYINNEEENKKHFKDNYFYTGDLATYDGTNYILKGRSDDMIKIDGNRIEPSEIEAVCKRKLNLSLCVAKGFEVEGVVVLYYTDNKEIDEEKARELLEEELPYYMIPSFFVHKDYIPLNASGKQDKKALLLPKEMLKAPYIEPRNDFEKKLASAFEKVLEIKEIGIRDDFFKLGGNSIKAMEVLSLLNIDELTPNILFKGRTIEKISKEIEEADKNKLTEEEKEEIGRKQNYLFITTSIWLYKICNNGTQDFIAAFRLSPFVSLKKLCRVFNEYAKLNSTFQLAVEEDEHGYPHQKYLDNTKPFEIEHMTEKEVDELRKTFIQPFKSGDRLVRIRFIKTKLHSYFFFDMAHLCTDGAGVYLLLQDILKLYKGEEVRKSLYFAWAYDMAQKLDEDTIKANCEYYINRLDMHNRNSWFAEETGLPSKYNNVNTLSFDMKDVNNCINAYNSTVNDFVNAVCLGGMNVYTGTDTFTNAVYDNRAPHDNIAGMRALTSPVGLKKDAKSLIELFQDLADQQYNIICRNNFNFLEYRSNYGLGRCTLISYVADKFDDNNGLSKFGKQLELINSANTGGYDTLNINIRIYKGRLLFKFEYAESLITREHAEKFNRCMEYVGNEILNGRLPDFKKKID